MVVGNVDTIAGAGEANSAHPSGIPQDQIDNIMSGIANTGDVKMNNHRKKLRQRFDIIKKLGQGTYGKVQLGINKETGQEVAIKTIKKCKIEAEADLVRIRREVQIMSSVQHPNIIHIYEVFENREKMVLVMEFAAGGELYDYLSERKVLSEEEARRIFRQVATAVYYCHKHKICHRDLKLENILLDEQGNAKIADFGLSNVFDDHRLLATFCGSPLYASPEIVEGTPYQGPEVDCWSLGVLLYTLVYGSMPFDGSNFKRLVKQISQGDYYEPKKPSRASALIREMLTVCPRKRATIEQICSHWWVNENDPVSCLELAEDLANQTPVRLDVLLSLTPAAITADQLVVPSSDGSGAAGKTGAVPRSHSVGSMRDIGPNTEAERRILDMVAAGGEAALMPSPTRTITPTQSPVQTKRKLATTVSMDNAAIKKKEKPGSASFINEAKESSFMETEDNIDEENMESSSKPNATFSAKDMEMVSDLCEQLIKDNNSNAITNISNASEEPISATQQNSVNKLDPVEEVSVGARDATKVIKKFVNKHKTADLVNAIGQITPETNITADSVPSNQSSLTKTATTTGSAAPFPRKGSLQDDSTLSNKVNGERRKSRILETAEKFQQLNSAPASGTEKPKKFVIPGVSVGSFKKEFERKASTSGTAQIPTPGERRALEQIASANIAAEEYESAGANVASIAEESNVETCDSKTSVTSLTLEDARRSMENSIALLRQAQTESSSKVVNELCAKTENISVSDLASPAKLGERERKLKNARAIIGNAIQPVLRRPQPPPSSSSFATVSSFFGNGGGGYGQMRATSGSSLGFVRGNAGSNRFDKQLHLVAPLSNIAQEQPSQTTTTTGANEGGGSGTGSGLKTSTASITLKSATLPRRKTAKTEIQLDIKPRIVEQPTMRFTTEMQHPVPDLRSAPAREGSSPYSPIKSMLSTRATSLEPKEHIIPIQRPQPAYIRTTSNTTTRSDSLSRQSTNDSESDTTTTNMSQTTITGSSQPIKKSPREFIIPIAVEGGGFITPREGSVEPSESSHTAAITSSRSTFNRLRPTRRIGSLLSETSVDENSPFQKLRNTSLNREGDDDVPFTLHKLRSSRPIKKLSQDNDSQSSGEDDDDGFEILTAENLFSTLLQRVRALTNRLNVNHDITTGFPSSNRLLNNMRQAQSSFWNQEPFSSRLNNTTTTTNNMSAPWRHSVSRDLGSNMESMFSRTGATLPRGCKPSDNVNTQKILPEDKNSTEDSTTDERLDLADLDLSRLRLSKKDLETLSSITPGLPKCFQEQLLAKLPPTQARKLSRTLSMQNNPQKTVVKIYKRSQSSGRGALTIPEDNIDNIMKTEINIKGEDKETSVNKKSFEEQVCSKRNLGQIRHDQACDTSVSAAEELTSQCERSCVGRDESVGKTFRPSEINDKYKYYSPYLNKTSKVSQAESEPVTFQKTNDTFSNAAALRRPPSGCASPPPTTLMDGGNNSLRRRSPQCRISRLLRSDIFEKHNEENPNENTQIDKHDLREKSSTSDLTQSQESDNMLMHKRGNSELCKDETKHPEIRHARNKSLEVYSSRDNIKDVPQDVKKQQRRSLSRPREVAEERLDKHALADKILQELQLLSAMRSHHEIEQSVERIEEPTIEKIIHEFNMDKDKMPTMIKKSKKIKTKEKLNDSAIDAETKAISSGLKKIKKIVKKSETIHKSTINEPNVISTSPERIKNIESVNDLESAKKESKLKRPKSYPTKDSTINSANATEMPKVVPVNICSTTEDKFLGVDNIKATPLSDAVLRDSRLLRPKSYPSTKLSAGTKDLKKSAHSAKAVGKIDELSLAAVVEVKSERIPVPEVRNSETKKAVKIPKKTKICQPSTTLLSTSANANAAASLTTTTSSTGDDSKESSPTTVIHIKEKSPEKRINKGLLRAIGQKFEKLRDSAMNKEKRASCYTTASHSSPKNCSPESSSPEKIKDKISLLHKKKKVEAVGISPSSDENVLENSKKRTGNKTNKTSGGSQADEIKPAKNDKRSRIDAMIRSLRERSIPRSPSVLTESNYIKRAISVEEMPGTCNKKSVNKVLGLFKRFERDTSAEGRVRNVRSTSNIERQIRTCSPSPIYENLKTPRKQDDHQSAKLNNANIVSKRNEETRRLQTCRCEGEAASTISTQNTICPDCVQNIAISSAVHPQYLSNKSSVVANLTSYVEEKILQGNKDKRKNLILDLNKSEKPEQHNLTKASYSTTQTSHYPHNVNGIYSNLPPYPGTSQSSSNNSSSLHSMENNSNNNNNNNNSNNNSSIINNNNSSSQISGYRSSAAVHEINRNNNFISPSFDNIANYSSDSRSCQDDCVSNSTFLSPTEEPELYFDNWSVCSEDNYMLQGATPSPTVSRLSRTSQVSSPTRGGDISDPNESMIDRIKRRSFYSRFNEKKPKRASSIVGPNAVREYYREQQAVLKSRTSNKSQETEREPSPDITQEFLRPLKLSPIGTELKPPVYKAPSSRECGNDYSSSAGRPRKSLNDIRSPASPSFLSSSRRYGSSTVTDNDYLTASSMIPLRNNKSNQYDGGSINTTNGSGNTTMNSYYGTYNPKRRSSYTLNGTLSMGGNISSTSPIDGYATVGRRPIRPYEQRTISLLESSSGGSNYRREPVFSASTRDYSTSISRKYLQLIVYFCHSPHPPPKTIIDVGELDDQDWGKVEFSSFECFCCYFLPNFISSQLEVNRYAIFYVIHIIIINNWIGKREENQAPLIIDSISFIKNITFKLISLMMMSSYLRRYHNRNCFDL
uniref:Protein kinase domain-containing protein n=1 Tax=Glossina brevipalpis TaxID=37001 RepID=A0A1A9WLS0_9MUSC